MAFTGGSVGIGRVFTPAAHLARPCAAPARAARLVNCDILGRPGPSATPGSTPRFDPARMTSTRPGVFDLPGRRGAVPTDREFAPGSCNLPRDGRSERAAPLVRDLISCA